MECHLCNWSKRWTATSVADQNNEPPSLHFGFLILLFYCQEQEGFYSVAYLAVKQAL